MVCRAIKPNINKVCIGDLNKKVKIEYSASIPDNSPDVNVGTSFTNIKSVWAMIKTRSTAEFLSKTNIEDSITTEFYIRYDSSIDLKQRLWVEYNNIRYLIVNTENIDEEDKFVKLTAVERGTKTINANLR